MGSALAVGVLEMRRTCAVCSKARGRAQAKSYRAMPVGRAARNKDKAIRRARVAIMAEAIDPIAVCERDGWQCHLCGVDTPKELRGSNDPRAPEIDHVHPLALGGGHTWSNVRCACRRCNGMKGAKTMEEFIQLPRGGGSNIQARSSRKPSSESFSYIRNTL